MKENYYRLERKRKKKRNTRLFLLSGIAVLVCIGVVAAAAVMNSSFGGDVTGSISSTVVSSSVSSDIVSADVSSVASSVASSDISEAVSSAAVSSAASSSQTTSSKASSAVSSVVSAATSSNASKVASTSDSETAFVQNTVKENYDYSKPVGESAAVDKSFFNNTVLIGDSRAAGFHTSVGLSNMKSYTKVGGTASTAIKNDLPSIKATPNKYKRAYIMLGTNEISLNYDTVMSNYEKLIDGLQSCQKDIEIYVQAVLPITKYCHQNHSYLRKEKINTFNQRLQQMAQKKQVYFVNPTSALAGADGFLPAELASAKDGYHLKKDGYLKQLAYLKTHTVKS